MNIELRFMFVARMHVEVTKRSSDVRLLERTLAAVIDNYKLEKPMSPLLIGFFYGRKRFIEIIGVK
jgi:hypothetical protein